MNLLPYSEWTLNHHLSALQMYEWMRSVYRCTGQTLCVSKMTAYRWVSGFGYQWLPLAALFGVVRSSGVAGIDEKYVLVPKNNEPAGDMKRWMYVRLWRCRRLLHLRLVTHRNLSLQRQAERQSFPAALRAKGYHPRVIVTDMRVTTVVSQHNGLLHPFGRYPQLDTVAGVSFVGWDNVRYNVPHVSRFT